MASGANRWLRSCVRMRKNYFVLKPKHSGFFSTTLELLLDQFQAHTVILTGLAANICVLFTANDAYLRGYNVVVPSDCVASNTKEDTRVTLEQLQTILKADVGPSHELDLGELMTQPEPNRGQLRMVSE